MSTANLTDTNPITLTAVVTPVVGGTYTLSLSCGTTTNVDLIEDEFSTMPSTVAVNVTSSTVPSGFHLETSGHGSWTTVSSSLLTGTFTGTHLATYDFVVELYNGTTKVASSDPRLILRTVGAP